MHKQMGAHWRVSLVSPAQGQKSSLNKSSLFLETVLPMDMKTLVGFLRER